MEEKTSSGGYYAIFNQHLHQVIVRYSPAQLNVWKSSRETEAHSRVEYVLVV